MCFKTFRKRIYSKTDAEFLHVLQTRAWILHSCYTFWKLFAWVLGMSLWLNDECAAETENLCPEYNRKFLDPITPVVRVLIGVLVIISVFIDIACYKFRFLAQSVLYCEVTFTLLL